MPARVLEVEALVLLVLLRLEKLYNSYSLRLLWFLPNYLLKTVLYSTSFQDFLGDMATEDIPIFRNL